jgi:tRNA threonylcarbamoyladenosine modification (KEOPS) complex Cgi121 subunit
LNKNDEIKIEKDFKDIYQFEELKVLVKGFFLFDNDIKKVYDKIRSLHKDVYLVIVNANIVFGLDHIFGIMKIISEEIKRENKKDIKNFDIEFLLRICYTDQISYAFQMVNDNKDNNYFICIIFSKCLTSIKNAYIDLKNYGKEDYVNTLVQVSKAKRFYIVKLFFDKNLKDLDDLYLLKDDCEFQKFLIERSAIALK